MIQIYQVSQIILTPSNDQKLILNMIKLNQREMVQHIALLVYSTSFHVSQIIWRRDGCTS